MGKKKGSHEFEDVVKDFNAYFPHVAPGGIVALHDVDPRGSEATKGGGWEGPLLAWEKVVKPELTETGACASIAYGKKIIG